MSLGSQGSRSRWMLYAANLERAPAHTQVVVAAAELSHNADGRAFTLAQLVQHLGHPLALLGSDFPQWGRELWQPIQTAVLKAQLLVHTFVAEHVPRYVEKAFALVLQREGTAGASAAPAAGNNSATRSGALWNSP
jgi:hypothetical protein